MNDLRIQLFTRRWLYEWTTTPQPPGRRASRLMFDLISFRPEDAWRRILAIISAADDDALGLVGAGPLEDLIREHAAVFIDRAEALASVDWRFRKALSNVIVVSSVSPEIWTRICNATNKESRA